VFPKKDHAFDYAQNRVCFRSGEIRVLDLIGNVEWVIPFDDAIGSYDAVIETREHAGDFKEA